jgi:hypothetical protein
MMSIDWTESALKKLLDYTASAPPEKQLEVMAATHEIDSLLANAPDQAGESRGSGERVLIAGPLAVTFRLNIRLKKVFITRVTIYQKR